MLDREYYNKETGEKLTANDLIDKLVDCYDFSVTKPNSPKEQTGSGLVNTLINKVPFEAHLPSVSFWYIALSFTTNDSSHKKTFDFIIFFLCNSIDTVVLVHI